jgi:hypothetical protein
MNAAIVSALAALGGSTVGAFAPVMSNYVIQRSQTDREILNRHITERETLYLDFIKESSHLYADSVGQSLANTDSIVALYALVGCIRLVASRPVLQAAEDLIKVIMRQYGEPNLSAEQIRTSALLANSGPLDKFSSACRKELEDLLRHRSVRHGGRR